MIGKTISHYEILDELGSGGMGVVYSARDLRLGRRVALKFLPTAYERDPETRERFLREAKAASAVNHPNICTVYDVDEFEGRPFIAMEFLDGRNLRALIGGKPLPGAQALDLAIGLAEALSAAHGAGFVHRDVKPANLFVTGGGQAKLLDFGLAKRQTADGVPAGDGAALTLPGVTLGTLPYMSPEQARGERLDSRSDIFSFGSVLYEMLTGVPAFPPAPAMVMAEAILRKDPKAVEVLNPAAPAPLVKIAARCMQKKKDARYASADELLGDLRKVRRELETRPTEETSSFMAAASGAPSLAILPFDNVGGNPDADYLAEGLPEALINALSSISGLRVMARSTVFRYQGRTQDPQAIGRELGVGTVLSGRIRHRPGALSVAVELLDVERGWQTWGERYDRQLDDLMAVEEEITREISRNLRLKLTGEEDRRLAARPVNPAAHQAYLTGRYHWNRWTAEGFRAAIEHYERAIAADPEYALAYAGLADAWCLLGLYAMALPKEAFPRARESAAMALALDPDLAEAHAAQAATRFFHEWDWPGARADFDRAIELKPGYVSAHHLHSSALSAVGRHQDAIAEAQQALDLDPFSLAAILNAGWARFYARDWAGAEAQCRHALTLDARFVRGWELLAMSLALQGHEHEALVEARRVLTAGDDSPRSLTVCGFVFASCGSKEEARQTVAALREMAASRYVPALSLGFVSAALGKKDAAFGFLERALEEQDSLLVWLRVEPRLDNLRGDPRFEALQARVGARLWEK